MLLRYIYDSNDSIRAWTDTNSVVISMLAVVKLGVALWFSSRIAKWTEKDADRFAVELAIRFGLGREMNPQGMKPVSPAQHLVDALETASQGAIADERAGSIRSIQERTELCSQISIVRQTRGVDLRRFAFERCKIVATLRRNDLGHIDFVSFELLDLCAMRAAGHDLRASFPDVVEGTGSHNSS